MKKKVLSLILAAVMALSLAACGGGSKDGTEADGTTAAPKGTEAEGESAEGGSTGGETVKFALVGPLTGNNAYAGEAMFNSAKMVIDAYN